MLTGKEKSLLDILEPLAEAKGIEIVTLEIVGAKKSPTIRVYIDTDHGVGFDELSSAQAWINDVMDEVDPFPGAYMLEVSSPGIDRPLRTLAHFQNVEGKQVSVKTTTPIEGRSSFKGVLSEVAPENIVVTCDNNEYSIPMQSLKKANLVGEISFQ